MVPAAAVRRHAPPPRSNPGDARAIDLAVRALEGPSLLAATLLVLAPALALSCIERAPGSGARRERVAPELAARYLLASVRPRVEVGAVYGDALELLGLDLEPPTLCAGRPSTLTLYWHVLNEPEARWQVFVHLDGPSLARVHADHAPAQGVYPTTAWRKGEIVRDPVAVTLPADEAASLLEAWVGLYSGAERMPVTKAGPLGVDNEDRALAARIPVLCQ